MRLLPAEALNRNRQFLINSGAAQWLSGRNQSTRRTTGGFLQHSARPGKTPGSPRPKLPRSSIGLNRSCRSASPENAGSIPWTSASSRASIESLFHTSWRKIRRRRTAVARAHETSRSPLLKAASHDFRPVRRHILSTMPPAPTFFSAVTGRSRSVQGQQSLYQIARNVVARLLRPSFAWPGRHPKGITALSRSFVIAAHLGLLEGSLAAPAPCRARGKKVHSRSGRDLWSTYVRAVIPCSKLVSQAAGLSRLGLLAQREGWRARPRRAP